MMRQKTAEKLTQEAAERTATESSGPAAKLPGDDGTAKPTNEPLQSPLDTTSESPAGTVDVKRGKPAGKPSSVSVDISAAEKDAGKKRHKACY